MKNHSVPCARPFDCKLCVHCGACKCWSAVVEAAQAVVNYWGNVPTGSPTNDANLAALIKALKK